MKSAELKEIKIKITSILALTKAFFILLIRRSASLPLTLVTKNDFELVLKYYLLNYWDMKHESIDGFEHLTIQNHLPFYKKRFKEMKKVIDERKIIGVFVHYA